MRQSGEGLILILDHESGIAKFSGQTTFVWKDEIKKTGARWNPAEKCWFISIRSFDQQTVKKLLPGCEIFNNNKSTEKSADMAADMPAGISAGISAGIYAGIYNSEASPANSNNTTELLDPPSGQFPDANSVNQLVVGIRKAILAAYSKTILLYGVILSVRGNGKQIYIQLADMQDRDVSLDCAIYSNSERIIAPLREAGFNLEANLPVMFQVSVSITKSTRIIANIEKIIPEFTRSKLASLRDETNNRLKSEGIFNLNKNLAIPFLPKKLGVITSKNGTVINDLIAGLDEAKFGFELFWIHTAMQGELAKGEIIRSIEYFNDKSEVDLILIFRGGGSQSDLMIFNDYDVAKAVCVSKIPVLSALGHEEDQSSVRDVSCKNFGVTKAIGLFLKDIIIDHRRSVEAFAANCKFHIDKLLESKAKVIDNTLSLIQLRVEGMLVQREAFLNSFLENAHLLISKLTQQKQLQLDNAINIIQAKSIHLIELMGSKVHYILKDVSLRMELRIENLSDRLRGYQELFEELSPDRQLKRGYAMVKKGDQVIASAKNIQLGDEVEIRFFDGEALGEIKKI